MERSLEEELTRLEVEWILQGRRRFLTWMAARWMVLSFTGWGKKRRTKYGWEDE